MAVIITKADGNLSDANNYYRVEAHSLNSWSSATKSQVLSTTRTISVTFANAGNCLGVGLYLINPTVSAVNCDRSVLVELQEDVAGTWTTRASVTKTWASIHQMNSSVAYYTVGDYAVAFEFTSSYAVDTTAAKWRFRISQTGGTAGDIYLILGVNAYPTYFTWCDTLMSFTNDDTLIVKNYLEIDQSFSLAGVLGTGDVTYGTACIICSNTTAIDYANVSFLTYDPVTYTSAITMTLKGSMVLRGHSGIRIGDEGNRVPAAYPFTIDFTTPNVGTARPTIWDGAFYYSCKANLFFYGEEVQNKVAMTANIAVGAGSTVVAEDMSTKWANGQTIVFSKQVGKGQLSNQEYAISSISGTTINFTPNNATYTKSGTNAFVLNLNVYGIHFNNSVASSYISIAIPQPSSCIFKGCKFTRARYYGIVSPLYTYGLVFDKSTDYLQTYFKSCIFHDNYGASQDSIYGLQVAPKGILFEDIVCWRFGFYSGGVWFNESGLVEIKNCVASQYRGSYPLQTQGDAYGYIKDVYCKLKITNLYLNNAYPTSMYLQGKVEIDGLYIYGIAVTGAAGMIYFYNVYSSKNMKNIYLDNQTNGISILTFVNSKMTNVVFGSETANTLDLILMNGAVPMGVIDSPIGLSTFTNYQDTIMEGVYLAIVDDGGVYNVTNVYEKYGTLSIAGDSLADTTVHTSGSGKYCMRFEPINSTDCLEYETDIPTGNIQTKAITISAWIKINSATYYAGTCVNPTLTISYDGGVSENTTVAADTTDWQQIFVTVIPATNAGKITMKVGGCTDATGSNAYFYMDDIAVSYPPNIQLDLGGLNLWQDGFPVTPPITTSINASDLWAYLSANATVSGSMGKLVKDIMIEVQNNQGLILTK